MSTKNSPSNADEVQRFLDAWLQLRQVVQAANFNRFQREGLSATQFIALNVLPSSGPGMMLTELARALNLSPSTLNKTVESLEARGLVERRRSDADARKLEIRITSAGSRLQNAASGDFHRYMTSLFRKLSRSQRDGLLTGLEALAAVALPESEATPRGGPAAPAKRSSSRSALR